MHEQPEPPEGGIPKQRLPAFIRWAIILPLTPFVIFDVFCRRMATKLLRPPLKKVGACHRRGNCCYYIRMKKYRGPLGWIQRFWAFEINGFYLREKEAVLMHGHHYYIMGCRHLKEDGSCKNYRTRPMICREWPKIEYFGHPILLKGCGYMAVDRKNPLKIIQ